ncbi:MAG: GNAT family N-acetyltransferase [Clostridiales bacterium]|nr:GNAT family N-acetyltransferase [Clostridiales bacterium]
MKLELFRLTPGSAKQWQEVLELSFSSYYSSYEEFPGCPAYETLNETLYIMNHPFGASYWMLIDNEIIGGIRVLWSINSTKFRLDSIFIIPDFQNQGFGQKFAKMVEKLYPTAVSWELNAIAEEERCIHFFEKLGYRREGSVYEANSLCNEVFMKKQASSPRVILMCGKICSGKTSAAKELMGMTKAVLLSCDEVMEALFGEDAEEEHNSYLKKLQLHLFDKSVEIVNSGISVILDWGFWTEKERSEVDRFYGRHQIFTEWHHVNVSEGNWKKYLAKRNSEIDKGLRKGSKLDYETAKALGDMFEAPDEDDMECWALHPSYQPVETEN